MPYPDNFSARAYDAAQGRDETPEPEAESAYEAARDLLHALDRGFITVDRPGSAFVTALRVAVARERDERAEDERRRAEAGARLMALAGRVA